MSKEKTDSKIMADEPGAIDRHGDLRLKVGSPQQAGDTLCQRVEFLVCSRALARASPVFDRMLYGAFAEASHNQTSSEGWTVELKEDKPAAMEVFLNIAHANFARVPHVLSVDGLYDVAVLTHYYDATRLLAPWVGSWMASIVEMTRDANVIMPKMLWISWEFGRKEDFIAVARRMLMEAKTPWAMEPDSEDDAVQTPPHIVGKTSPLDMKTLPRATGSDIKSRGLTCQPLPHRAHKHSPSPDDPGAARYSQGPGRQAHGGGRRAKVVPPRDISRTPPVRVDAARFHHVLSGEGGTLAAARGCRRRAQPV